MTAECPLCEYDAVDPGDVNARLTREYWPEDGRPDYLALKRDLEEELEVELTVSTLKRHVNDHVEYTWAAGEEGSA